MCQLAAGLHLQRVVSIQFRKAPCHAFECKHIEVPGIVRQADFLTAMCSPNHSLSSVLETFPLATPMIFFSDYQLTRLFRGR